MPIYLLETPSIIPPTTSTLTCQHPICTSVRPLVCAAPDCPRLVHFARRCSGLSARQGRWICRQIRQSNHLPETVAGHPAHHSYGSFIRTVACNMDPFACSSCHTSFHRSDSGLTGDAGAAALAEFEGVVQRLRHFFGRDHCIPTCSSLSQLPESASQPSASSSGMPTGFLPKSMRSDNGNS